LFFQLGLYLDAAASDVALLATEWQASPAGASISQVTDASRLSFLRVRGESFDDGSWLLKSFPQLWLWDRYNVQIPTLHEERVGGLGVLTAKLEGLNATERSLKFPE